MYKLGDDGTDFEQAAGGCGRETEVGYETSERTKSEWDNGVTSLKLNLHFKQNQMATQTIFDFADADGEMMRSR